MSKENQFAEAGMLIRKPVKQVYESFINPEITTKFWFTKSTGRLTEGAEITWSWEMYNVSNTILVKSLNPDKSIIIEWGDSDNRSTVEWTFITLDESRTFVKVINSGFKGTPDEIIAKVRDSTGGFTLVLSNLKAYLEHNINLNLIFDRFPKELGKH